MISADTNLFFAWLNSVHPGHKPASEWFTAMDGSSEFAVCELTLVELYGLLRNPAVVDEPLSAHKAVAMIQKIRTHPRWNLIDYPGSLMEKVWKAAETRDFARRRIYDARLALALRHHGVTDFATVNLKDFEGFGFRKLWNPVADN